MKAAYLVEAYLAENWDRCSALCSKLLDMAHLLVEFGVFRLLFLQNNEKCFWWCLPICSKHCAIHEVHDQPQVQGVGCQSQKSMGLGQKMFSFTIFFLVCQWFGV